MAKAKIALNLKDMSVNDEVAFGKKLTKGIRASTLPQVLKDELSDNVEGTSENLEVAENNAKSQADVAKSATMTRDQSRLEYVEMMNDVAASVEKATNSDGAQMEAMGYQLASTNRASAEMTRVEDLQLSPGDFGGQLHAQWKPIAGAKLYKTEWRVAGTPSTPAGDWRPSDPSSGSKCDVNGLPSNVPVDVRVCAQGAKNVFGPWSDAATMAAQ